ncbi:ATP-binding cassette domain-containing protein [Spirillospora sp. CA-142024]|uniref:ATP-binding cassette domain-containing protein n=1 Tax=Spirillospora sp. CA-142024 TaxID=3240036 RepID=UPI003D8BAF5E
MERTTLSRSETLDGTLGYGDPSSVQARSGRSEQPARDGGGGGSGGSDPGTRSGGEKQRVAIARAVLGDPTLLLADEPTGALDSGSGAVVMELLHGLHRTGTTIAVITHDRDIAASLPREVRIKDGRIEHDSALPERVGA